MYVFKAFKLKPLLRKSYLLHNKERFVHYVCDMSRSILWLRPLYYLVCTLQVNMPTDSFESPLTLAACGGHVELAMLLLERGANIEEVNDEGYTPLMEAAREGTYPHDNYML